MEMQLLKPLPASVEAALTASIKRFGVLVPVCVDQDGEILDGNHRKAIADRLGITYRTDMVRVAEEDRADVVIAINDARRQKLTRQQRDEVAAALFAEGHSENAVAEVIGMSKTSAHELKNQLVRKDQLTLPERTTGLDGKSRPSTRRGSANGKGPRVNKTRQAERAEEQAHIDRMLAAQPDRVIASRVSPRVVAAQEKVRNAIGEARISLLRALNDPGLDVEFALAERKAPPDFRVLAAARALGTLLKEFRDKLADLDKAAQASANGADSPVRECTEGHG